MNIIIPLGGKGERFIKNGYDKPKPLIQIFEKCMIDYVIDNLCISKNDKVFIIYNKNLDKYNFNEYINSKFPFINLIKINDTKGASETLFLGIEIILNNYEYNKKTIILDCDTFYTENILNIFNGFDENLVFYRKKDDKDPIYSYIELNNENDIINIKEKEQISNNANTGAYAFTDINILYTHCKYVLDNNITFNNEPYTSCVISVMIKKGFTFKGYELKDECVFSLGTPIDVEKYITNTYAFLFDLDGTLVITDKIYYDVWYEILFKYNIILNEEIFKKYIQGNNDIYVKNTLLKTINITCLDLSKLKDSLFVKKINDIKIVDGVYDILKKIKLYGNKICIVTNCNKNIANNIVKFINIDNFIDFIISNDDCEFGKPNPEPYKKAIERYNIENNKCFIFEDSKTGLISGKGVNPKLLIGIETNYDNETLINIGANLSIKNYLNFDINDYLYTTQIDTINYLKKIIKTNSNILDIKDILIDNNKLKGGFIADVVSYKIVTSDKIYSQILKYENSNINNLNIIAKKLELYKREYYFYTHISQYVNIKIPIFYNLLIDENDNTIGIILENLFDKKYDINLNLNVESIDISLKIVNRMALLHSKFWNKNLKKLFPKLKDSRDCIFNPFLCDFINEKYDLFKQNWSKILNNYQLQKCDEIYNNFNKIQTRFSNNNNLTFIHGDIKSPNIFYDVKNDYEPYFIDWQHCAIGKGSQDLIFFVIESFDIENSLRMFNILKEYYFKKLFENGITNYSYEEYETDLYYSICYIPFFTSIWFGSTLQDELIDKNFPYFFITKLFNLIEYVTTNKNIVF
jgi:HAD superfamily hydrolase (TIGR01509 family)